MNEAVNSIEQAFASFYNEVSKGASALLTAEVPCLDENILVVYKPLMHL